MPLVERNLIRSQQDLLRLQARGALHLNIPLLIVQGRTEVIRFRLMSTSIDPDGVAQVIDQVG